MEVYTLESVLVSFSNLRLSAAEETSKYRHENRSSLQWSPYSSLILLRVQTSSFFMNRTKERIKTVKPNCPIHRFFLSSRNGSRFIFSMPEYNHIIKQNSTTQSKPEYGSSKKSTRAHGLTAVFKKIKTDFHKLLDRDHVNE